MAPDLSDTTTTLRPRLRMLAAAAACALAALAGWAPASATAETFTGLHGRVVVGQFLGDGAQAGDVPLTVHWELSQPGGVVDPTCYGEWTWPQVTVDIREGRDRDGRVVFSGAGSGRNGSLSTRLPSPSPSQESGYTAWISGSVSRSANFSVACPWGAGADDVRTIDEYVTFSLPYPSARDCALDVASMLGKADVRRLTSDDSQAVERGSTLQPGSALTVRRGGRVDLRSSGATGASTLRAFAGAVLAMTRGDCSKMQKFTLDLLRGSMASTVTNARGRRNQVKVTTGNAVIDVSSATYEVSASGTPARPVTRVKVRSGKVSVVNPKRRAVKRIVSAGEQTSVVGRTAAPARPSTFR